MQADNIRNQGSSTSGVPPPTCPVCFKPIAGGFAYFSFGAVVDLFVLEKAGLRDDLLEGFCHVGYHGTDPEMKDSAGYAIADGIPGGNWISSFVRLRA